MIHKNINDIETMYRNEQEGTMTLRSCCHHSIDGAMRQWIIAKRTFSKAEKLIPCHIAEGVMERMIIIHGPVVKIAENLPRNGLNGLRRDDIIETTMIEHHGDFNPMGQIGLKLDQIQGRGEKDQFSDGPRVLTGINNRHEPAITGSDQDQTGFVLQEAIQFIHAPIQRAEKILEDHAGIFIPEEFPFCAVACAFKSVDKYAFQGHGDQLCIKNDRSGIAFPLI
jgi:hypothetical protein